MNRIKQLDSLRGIAVILVILHHNPAFTAGAIMDRLPLGSNMFLVLSGYLITSILLHEKRKALSQGTSNLVLFRNFIARRALRIFPLYYLTLLLLTLFGHLQPHFLLSLASFTANFYIYLKQDWISLSHCWSLSVREQFYFLWPIVVLLTPLKRMVPVILCFIGMAIILNQAVAYNEFVPILTPFCFDALGAGALLAWFNPDNDAAFGKTYRWLCVAAAASLLLMVASGVLGMELMLPFCTFYSVLVMWLIAYIVYKGEKGIFNKTYLLNNPALQFIGMVSFGLYLLHPIIPEILKLPLSNLGDQMFGSSSIFSKAFMIAGQYLILLLVSWLSFRFIESPFLKMKKYFSVRKMPPTNNPAQVPVPAVPGILVSGEVEKRQVT